MLPKDSYVLIVDDQQAMRQTMSYIMRSFGYTNLLYATDGVMAWSQLELSPNIGLVLLDWSMPKMTGLELLKKIRKTPQFKSLPVLMITAEAEREQVLQAVNSGVTNYIVKPLTPVTLERKLKEIFTN